MPALRFGAFVCVAVAAGSALRAEPSEAIAPNEAGLASLTAGRALEAIGRFEAAARAAPNDAVIRRNLAAALAAEADQLRQAEEFDGAARLLDRAITLHPSRLRYRVLRGRARFEGGRAAERISAYEDFAWVLALDPEHLDALVNLGQIAYAERRLPEAERCWTAALRLSPDDSDIRTRLDRARREGAVEEAFEELRSARFRVRFGASVSREQAGEVRRLCETAHDELCARFGTHPAAETVVTLYSAAEFRSATQLHGWVAGLSDGSIRIAVRADTPLDELRATVYHEYTHHLIRGISPRVPPWLHEGLAQLAEGRNVPRAEARLRLSLPLPPSALDHAVLSESDPRRVGGFYDLALGFAWRLQELRGDAGFQELLQGIGRLRDIDEVMRRVYGGSRDELFADWTARLAAG